MSRTVKIKISIGCQRFAFLLRQSAVGEVCIDGKIDGYVIYYSELSDQHVTYKLAVIQQSW